MPAPSTDKNKFTFKDWRVYCSYIACLLHTLTVSLKVAPAQRYRLSYARMIDNWLLIDQILRLSFALLPHQLIVTIFGGCTAKQDDNFDSDHMYQNHQKSFDWNVRKTIQSSNNFFFLSHYSFIYCKDTMIRYY